MSKQPTVWDVAMQYRGALRAENDAALQRLARAYARIYERLKGQLTALENQILERQAAGLPFSPDWLRRQERYKQLMAQAAEELGRYRVVLETEVQGLVDVAIGQAGEDVIGLVSARMPGVPTAALRNVWNVLPTPAVEQALGYFAEGSPLAEWLGRYGAASVAEIEQGLAGAVATGMWPRKLAQEFRRQAGMPLTNALKLARTAQINAYREASRLSYVVNERIVPSWTWVSALEPGKTCMACVARHGSVHPVTERLNDHHQGWCVMAPNPRSYRELGLDVDGPPVTAIPAGAEWFKGQPEEVQRAFLGKRAFEAFSAGKVQVENMIEIVNDPVWGDIVHQRGLGAILGGVAVSEN